MLISFCIPTYNRAELLDRALVSILREFNGCNFEVIISDNASTDQTEKIIREYQSVWPNIRYFKNEMDVGLDANVLLAIQKAKGDYIWLFSDDDYLLKGSVKEVTETLNKYNPNFTYVRYRDYSEHEQPEDVLRRKTKVNVVSQVFNSGIEMFTKMYPVHFSGMIYKRVEVLKYLDKMNYYIKNNFVRGYTPAYLSHYILLKSNRPFVYIGKCCVAVRVLDNRGYNLIYSFGIDTLLECQRLKQDRLLNSKQIKKLINRHFMWHTAKILALLKVETDYITNKENVLLWKCYKSFPLAYLCIFPILLTPSLILKPPLNVVLAYRKIRNKITGLTEFEYE